MGFWTIYLALFLLAYLVQHPGLLVLAVVVFALSRWVPDPLVVLRSLGRVRSLRRQVAANPANAIARRDLARIYLERLRPNAALRQLDQARARNPDDPELLYLTGLARYRSGQLEEALDPLVQAVDGDPRVGFGHAYLVAGDALYRLGRYEEAVDAYERYTQTNSSSIRGWTQLALAHRGHDEPELARRALDEALSTWGQIPGYRRRQEFGWFLRANFYRWML